MTRLTWDQVRAWRLARQHLVEREPADRLLETVSDVCGIHAQVQSAAELQLWARVDDVTPEDVRVALWERRHLIRTWSMRGTLHVLTAADLPVYVAALRTHDRWWKGAWLRMIGCTADELRTILDAIRASLGALPLTRQQLSEEVGARISGELGLRVADRMVSGWAEMLKPAAFEGSLVSGPPHGQNVTFVRPDRWLGEWNDPDPADAWRQIVRRYLRAYGPATREEFGRWWGMQPAPAGRILSASTDELAEVEVDGQRAWVLADDVAVLAGEPPPLPVRLLPAFDVYVAGTRPRASLVDAAFEDRVFRTAGWVSPVVLVEGTVAGVWRHERTNRGRLDIAIEPFWKLAAAHRAAIDEEADRLGRFLGASVTVSLTA
ncbi:MAG: winged helix DNA-binding domain-containing protein [Acidimicrobiales bacterium]